MNSYVDVPTDYWAHDYIQEVSNDGWMVGKSTQPPKFGPEDDLIRAELAVILVRARLGVGYLPDKCTSDPFDDVKVTSWFCGWVKKAVELGLLSDYNGRFYPYRHMKRAEIAVVIVELTR